MLATCEEKLNLLQEKKDKGVNWRDGYHDLEKVYSEVISPHVFSMYSLAAYAYVASSYMQHFYTAFSYVVGCARRCSDAGGSVGIFWWCP